MTWSKKNNEHLECTIYLSWITSITAIYATDAICTVASGSSGAELVIFCSSFKPQIQ